MMAVKKKYLTVILRYSMLSKVQVGKDKKQDVSKMEKIVEQGLLYDFYGELLNEHQKQIFEDAVYNDMSLSEIADEQGISRQGVHDLLKRCNKALEDYEAKLHLVEKFQNVKKKINLINGLTEHAKESDREELHGQLQRIRELSDEILEEL